MALGIVFDSKQYWWKALPVHYRVTQFKLFSYLCMHIF